jgi:class 3 adenylate cyclase
MELVPGQRVERYVVINRMGAGRMATTYAIRHVTLNTHHALVVPNEPTTGLLRRMVAGAKIQARLRHASVVSATDVLDLGGVPALVLDHVEGPNLERFVMAHDLDEDAIDAVAHGLVEAVGFIHRNSVLHRHIKPKNVMVDVSGPSIIPRLTDFTLARQIGATEPIPRRRKPRVFGTPAFMSPEQTQDSDLIGIASDVWSLGCTLYYLTTGRYAFAQRDTESIFGAIRDGAFIPPRKHIPSMPGRWARAIEAALQVEQDARPDTAEAVGALWYEGLGDRRRTWSKTAPVGNVTLVFTDIQASTRIWEAGEQLARHSISAHDAVMRANLHRHGGYEVKTEGDAFMVAFTRPEKAIRFCLDVQKELHAHPWSTKLLKLPVAGEEPGFRGLRVRMGVHTGRPEARTRNNTVDYFGPMVNRAARISSAGHGGQTLVSSNTWRLAKRHLADEALARPLGSYQLRGLSEAEEILEVLPPDLAMREFPSLKADKLT